MKRVSLLVGIVCSVALLAPMANADEVYSRNVVGYHNITVEPGLNLVAFPFQKIPADTGVITTHDENTITVENAGWVENFGHTEEGESTFYLEVTSDAFEGRYMYIEYLDAETVTIVGGLPADMEAGVEPDLAGANYKIVAANRVRDIFGEVGSPAIKSGPGAGDADNVLFWTGSSWSAPVYYYFEAGAPFEGWRDVATGQFVNDMVLHRDAAAFVRVEDSATLTVAGEVSQNAQQIVMSAGLNLVGGVSVIQELIGPSQLDQSVQSGPGAGDADNVLFWTGSSWSSPIYYYFEAGAPFEGWRDVATGQFVGETFSFDPKSGYFIRIDEPIQPWYRPAPQIAGQ